MLLLASLAPICAIWIGLTLFGWARYGRRTPRVRAHRNSEHDIADLAAARRRAVRQGLIFHDTALISIVAAAVLLDRVIGLIVLFAAIWVLNKWRFVGAISYWLQTRRVSTLFTTSQFHHFPNVKRAERTAGMQALTNVLITAGLASISLGGLRTFLGTDLAIGLIPGHPYRSRESIWTVALFVLGIFGLTFARYFERLARRHTMQSTITSDTDPAVVLYLRSFQFDRCRLRGGRGPRHVFGDLLLPRCSAHGPC